MEMLPYYNQKELTNNPTEIEQKLFNIPRSQSHYRGTYHIDTVEKSQESSVFILQLDICVIGFNFEYKFNKPEISLGDNKIKHFIRSIVPLILSLSIVTTNETENLEIFSFSHDLRNPGIVSALSDIFKIPAMFTSHNTKENLFCLWQLGLPEPSRFWDTCIFETLTSLGQFSNKSKGSDPGNIRTEQDLKEKKEDYLSLHKTSIRRGIRYRFETDTSSIKLSIANHRTEHPFSVQQLAYVAEGSEVPAELYVLQALNSVKLDILNHCCKIEMPYVVTTSRIEWNGVKIDHAKVEALYQLIIPIEETTRELLLNKYSLENPRSHNQLQTFVNNLGISENFIKNGSTCFDKDNLSQNKHLHPAIEILSINRRAYDCLNNKLLNSLMIDTDNLVHAEQNPVGSDTGRQSTSNPNLFGLGGMLRPVIVPDPENYIGECDYSQVEPGIAGVVYECPALVEMYNTVDIYSAAALIIFNDELNDSDKKLTTREFRNLHPKLRDMAKPVLLGILYGMTAYGLAKALNIGIPQAELYRKTIINSLPGLEDAIIKNLQITEVRGFIQDSSGIRCKSRSKGVLCRSEKNKFINFPVQSSAAVVFKDACNRLDKLYKPYNAKIMVNLHDSIIFEAPKEHFEEVSEITASIMKLTLQEHYPALEPKVDLNIAHPHCWNKYGKLDAVSDWAKEALLKIEEVNS